MQLRLIRRLIHRNLYKQVSRMLTMLRNSCIKIVDSENDVFCNVLKSRDIGLTELNLRA